MGNINSCNNIVLSKDKICDIRFCTKQVSGKPSSSASPTDIFFVTLKDGTKYGEEVIPKEVVLKIYIEPTSNIFFKSLENPKNFKKDLQETDGLFYESEVYEHVVGPMTEYNFNPHFVNHYGNAHDCNFENVGLIWKGNSLPELDNQKISASIINSTFFMLKNFKREKRDKFEHGQDQLLRLIARNKLIETDIDWLYNSMVNLDIKYGIICTERSKGQSFSKWLQQPGNLINYVNGISTEIVSQNTLILLIQAVSCIVALEPFECTHNDLHFGNIIVNTLDEKIVRNYKYTDDSDNKDKIYSIETDLEIQFYDWDRAYVKKLGDNPYIKKRYDKICKYDSQCNRFVPQLDLLKIIINLCLTLKEKDPNSMVDIKRMMVEGASQSHLANSLFEKIIIGPKPSFLRIYGDNNTERTLTDEELGYFNTPSVFLSKLIEYTSSKYSNVNKIDSEKNDSQLYDFRKQNILNIIGQHTNNKDCGTNRECPPYYKCVQGKCKTGYLTRREREILEDEKNSLDYAASKQPTATILEFPSLFKTDNKEIYEPLPMLDDEIQRLYTLDENSQYVMQDENSAFDIIYGNPQFDKPYEKSQYVMQDENSLFDIGYGNPQFDIGYGNPQFDIGYRKPQFDNLYEKSVDDMKSNNSNTSLNSNEKAALAFNKALQKIDKENQESKMSDDIDSNINLDLDSPRPYFQS